VISAIFAPVFAVSFIGNNSKSLDSLTAKCFALK
jgi:hypothetical protein